MSLCFFQLNIKVLFDLSRSHISSDQQFALAYYPVTSSKCLEKDRTAQDLSDASPDYPLINQDYFEH